MHAQQNTTQSNKHRHTQTQTHASIYIYKVATIAKLGAISVFEIGRKRRQRSERVLPSRTYRSSSVPRIQGREDGERVNGDSTAVWSLQRRPRNSLPREIRECISLFLFSFFFKILYLSMYENR